MKKIKTTDFSLRQIKILARNAKRRSDNGPSTNLFCDGRSHAFIPQFRHVRVSDDDENYATIEFACI